MKRALVLSLPFVFATLCPTPVPALAEEPRPAGTVRSSSLSAEDLADFLGIGAWVFEYEGGRPKCWLEAEEVGQKTVSKKEILLVKEANKTPGADRGKILFFLRPSDLQLRIHSEASRGGSGIALPPDALWWGWKAFAGSTTRIEKPVAPKPGEDVVLLRYETQELEADAKDPKHPRKVVLTLKLAIEAD
ncbi:hypothetical protein [Paludisphaera mucosa]|uniref:Uncharacterized protein n=1 Tax=Paludisphaera mucosa TaxID=3030827 RepID=A0ABT6F936_9BACT|nr:hypothetical protein [Paludisphaera mucosa]MDG3004103.1 hypothetical protein [Paludisphaera mucosa]